MIAKLCLWVCMSMVIVCAVASIGCLLFAQWQGLKFAISLTAFFAAGAYLAKPSVDYHNEAKANDRVWRDLYKF